MKRTSKRVRGGELRPPRGARREAGAGNSIPIGPVDAAWQRSEESALATHSPERSIPVSLSQAQALWVAGDWDALADLDNALIAQHAHRDRLALLIASAHQQRANHGRARALVEQALAWGCDPRLLAGLLVADVHNTLGRVAALRNDDAQVKPHFQQAVGVADRRAAESAMHGRALREMASLGLLPQATALLRSEIDAVTKGKVRPGLTASRIEMLRSEVGVLQHEIQLMLQRNQLTAPRPAPEGSTLQAQLRRRSTAQLGQDLWVLERTGYKRDGYFVEFGATDGVRLSNTYLLETEFGWRGICAEPNPRFFAELQRNRRCTVSNACIGEKTGDTLEFVLAGEYGGFVKDMDRDSHGGKRNAYLSDAKNLQTFKTTSLHDLLTDKGAPTQIDYLSIDTEGSEFEILSAFPFESWQIRLLTVEHNFTADRQRIRDLLQSRGYRCTESQWDDWYELVP